MPQHDPAASSIHFIAAVLIWAVRSTIQYQRLQHMEMSWYASDTGYYIISNAGLFHKFKILTISLGLGYHNSFLQQVYTFMQHKNKCNLAVH